MVFFSLWDVDCGYCWDIFYAWPAMNHYRFWLCLLFCCVLDWQSSRSLTNRLERRDRAMPSTASDKSAFLLYSEQKSKPILAQKSIYTKNKKHSKRDVTSKCASVKSLSRYAEFPSSDTHVTWKPP